MKKKIILSTLLTLASLQSLGMGHWTPTYFAVGATALIGSLLIGRTPARQISHAQAVAMVCSSLALATYGYLKLPKKNELLELSLSEDQMAQDKLTLKQLDEEYLKWPQQNLKTELYLNPLQKEKTAFYRQLMSLPWSPVAQKYIEKLNAEEEALMQEFFNMCNITQEKWQFILKGIVALYNEASQKLIAQSKESSKELSRRVKLVMNSIHLADDRIKILSDDTAFQMQTTQQSIQLNEKRCLKMKNAEFDASVLHELMHILHDEGFQYTFIRFFASKLQVNHKLFNSFSLRFKNFAERRADMLAALVDPTHAIALAGSFQLSYTAEWFARAMDSTEDEHPYCYQRKAYLNKLHQEMIEAQNKYIPWPM